MRSKYYIHCICCFLNVIIDVTIEGEFVYTVLFAAIYTLIKLKWPPVNLIISNLMLALAFIND